MPPVDLHYNQVGIWRTRYEEFGLAGLEDEDRPGRPAVYDHNDVLLLVKLVTEDPPAGAARWTMEALADAMAEHGVPISASQAWRICKALDLKPWQVESWMTSHDPDFWAKASDVCGLYLHPPQNAVVWSVDEKSGMQAESRRNTTRRPSRAGGTDASSSTSATARGALPALGVPGHTGGMGDELVEERQLVALWTRWSTRPDRTSTCTTSPTTSRPTSRSGSASS